MFKMSENIEVYLFSVLLMNFDILLHDIPGFPVGGADPLGGCRPPTQVLFSENVCENKRTGSSRGCAPGTPPRSANDKVSG